MPVPDTKGRESSTAPVVSSESAPRKVGIPPLKSQHTKVSNSTPPVIDTYAIARYRETFESEQNVLAPAKTRSRSSTATLVSSRSAPRNVGMPPLKSQRTKASNSTPPVTDRYAIAWHQETFESELNVLAPAKTRSRSCTATVVSSESAPRVVGTPSLKSQPTTVSNSSPPVTDRFAIAKYQETFESEQKVLAPAKIRSRSCTATAMLQHLGIAAYTEIGTLPQQLALFSMPPRRCLSTTQAAIDSSSRVISRYVIARHQDTP